MVLQVQSLVNEDRVLGFEATVAPETHQHVKTYRLKGHEARSPLVQGCGQPGLRVIRVSRHGEGHGAQLEAAGQSTRWHLANKNHVHQPTP